MPEWGWIAIGVAVGIWVIIKIVRSMSAEQREKIKDEISTAIIGEVTKRYGPAKAAEIATTVVAAAKEGDLGKAAVKVGVEVADKLAAKIEEDTGIDYDEIRTAAGDHPLAIAARKAVKKEAENATKRKKVGKAVVKGAKIALNIAKNIVF
jgi:hypothetical protein